MSRLGILTSGGDAPGMNAAVRAAVRCADGLGLQMVGIRQGYTGLIEGDVIDLDNRAVGGIIERGGTILRTARSAAFLTEEGRRKALATVETCRLDGLVVIGGNGSLRGARWLHRAGVPTVGVPASIDSDVSGTEMAIGVDTALNTVVGCLDRLRDTAISHERVFIVEVMGRESGYIALMGGLAGGAEIILIPEEPTSLQRVASRVVEGLASGKRHSIVVVAEGFPIERRGGYEAVSAGRRIADVLESDRGLETRLTILGHLQRGGSPSAFDRILASRFGEAAVRYHAEGRTGEMTALSCGDVTGIPLDEIEKPGSHVDLALYRLAHTIAH